MLGFLWLLYYLTIAYAAVAKDTGSLCPYFDVNDGRIEFSRCDTTAITRGFVCTIKACKHCPSLKEDGSCLSFSKDDVANCYLVIRKYHTWVDAKRYCEDFSGNLFDPVDDKKITESLVFYISENERNCKKVWITGFGEPGASNKRDTNRCAQVGLCSQICTVTKTGYECSCKPEYSVDPDNKHVCRAAGEEPHLLVMDHYELHKINTRNYLDVSIEWSGVPATFDYDHESGRIFWLEYPNGDMYSAPISKPDEKKRITTAIGRDCSLLFHMNLAVDWINKNIYWTNPCEKTIQVINYDGSMEKTLIQFLQDTGALVVNPPQGYIYLVVGTRIERVAMDGTENRAIAEIDVNTRSLAYDYVLDTLYWSDNNGRLLRCDKNGKNERVILSRNMIRSIDCITIFEDYVYFAAIVSTKGSTRLSIYSASKFNGSSFKEIPKQRHVRPMKVYHKLCQPQAVSRCGQQTCSHFCLASPIAYPKGKGYTCACRKGYTLDRDGSGCLSTSELVLTKKIAVKPRTILPHNYLDNLAKQNGRNTRFLSFLVLLPLAPAVCIIYRRRSILKCCKPCCSTM